MHLLYQIPDWIFIFLVAALAAGQTFITSKGSLYDKRFTRQWWKFITRRGWVVIAFNLLIIGFLMWQKEEDDFRKSNSDLLLRYEENKRDLMIRIAVDSNRKILFKDLSEALGKQRLELDTVTRTLLAVRDSATTTIIQGDNTSVALCPFSGLSLIRQDSDTIWLRVNVCAESAAAILNEATIYIVVSPLTGTDVVKDLNFASAMKILGRNIGLPNKENIGQEIFIKGNNLDMAKTVLILLKGTYTDSYGNHKKIIDQIGILNLQKKHYDGLVTPPFDDMIRDFIKTKLR